MGLKSIKIPPNNCVEHEYVWISLNDDVYIDIIYFAKTSKQSYIQSYQTLINALFSFSC